MMTMRNQGVAEKRDLHIGGIGAGATAGLATILQPEVDDALKALRPLMRNARIAWRNANTVVRDNPLTAAALLGVAGLAAGYFLSRRF